MVQIYESARKLNSGKLYIIMLTTLILIIYLLYNRVAKNTVVKNNIDSNHTKLSFVYENTGLSVNGRWMGGFKHERRNVRANSMLMCLRSPRERPLHFVFNDERLNRVNAVEKLRELLNKTQVLLVGDSTMREFGLEMCALLGFKVSIKIFLYK